LRPQLRGRFVADLLGPEIARLEWTSITPSSLWINIDGEVACEKFAKDSLAKQLGRSHPGGRRERLPARRLGNPNGDALVGLTGRLRFRKVGRAARQSLRSSAAPMSDFGQCEADCHRASDLPPRGMVSVTRPASVDRFLADLQAIAAPAGRGDYTFPGPSGGHGFAQFIAKSHDTLIIHRLWTLQPGKGIGSSMLRTLCDLADRHAVTLTIKVVPIGRKPYPLTREQLVAWYQRYGFEGTRRRMTRLPRTADLIAVSK
jgi:hypothetical protein